MTTKATNVSEGLEPCPFCKTPPRGCEYVGDEDGGYWAIECVYGPGDHFAGVHGESEQSTISEWNTRATLSPPLPSPEVERRALELLATLCEIMGNKPGAFTLRTVGVVGTVFEQQHAAIVAALSTSLPSPLGVERP